MYTLLSIGPTEKLLNSTSEAILFAPLPTEILIVRHAHVHNPQDILYGRLPRFRLSTLGLQQAEETARFLAARPVAAVYSSPLLRARQTARILTHYHPSAPVGFSRLLLEVRTGYQGSSNSILKQGFSFFEPLKNPSDETMADVFNRIVTFLRRLVRHHQGQTVVAVTHADPIAIMRVGLLGLPLTVANMHATAYPARSSVNQVVVGPDRPPEITYFDVAREGPG
jgi:broad specificity phosphatase PhoE